MTAFFQTGVHRVFYRRYGCPSDAVVTAHVWSPSLVKSSEQTYTKFEGVPGLTPPLFYLDYNFEQVGGYIAATYENGVLRTTAAWRAHGVNDIVLDAVVEGSLSLREIQRIALAVLAGLAAGAGTTEQRFRDVANTKDRVVATVTQEGDRTVIVLDGS